MTFQKHILRVRACNIRNVRAKILLSSTLSNSDYEDLKKDLHAFEMLMRHEIAIIYARVPTHA